MIEQPLKELRKMTLLLSNRCQDGNLQSAFSCMEVVWTLYDKIMNWSKDNAKDEDRDIFIVSKGQATLGLLSILINKGFFTLEDMNDIGSFDSRFSIQTDVTKFQGGIENSAGSLGHGFPFAAGVAMANKIKKIPSQVYVLTGDGEFCEGTMWEACIFAAGKKLDNLCVVIDDNDSVGEMIEMGDFSAKLMSFGFDVFKVNGHDTKELEKVFKQAQLRNGKPKAVIAKTIRGYGSPTLMNHDIWFHKAPNKDELDQLIKEVELF